MQLVSTRFCNLVFMESGEAYVGDGDGRQNLASREVPETKSISILSAQARLEDAKRDNEIRGQDKILLEVDGEAVGRELLAENVESALDILGPLVDDVEVGISLDETAGRSTDGTTHVGDEETTEARD